MNKVLITLDEETSKLLAGEKNKSKLVREAIKYIKLDISPDTVDGLRKSYTQLTRKLEDMDSKLDYIASKLQ